MPDFLIDANLPVKISRWGNERFVHVSNINPSLDDETIWQYAKTNNLIIIKSLLTTHNLINLYTDSIEAIK